MASFENTFASSSSDTVQGSVSFNPHDSLIRTATMAVSYGMGLVEYRVSCETELSVGLPTLETLVTQSRQTWSLSLTLSE